MDRVETLRLEVDGVAVINSQKDLQTAFKKTQKELSLLEEGTDEWIKKSQELNQIGERVDDVKKKNKEAGQEWKKQGIEFQSGIKDRVEGMSLFGVSLGSAKSSLSSVGKTLTSTSKITKLFNAVLWASPIFLLAGVLATIVGYFTQTQEGMDLLAKGSRIFSDILNLLIQRIIKLGTAAFKVFKGMITLITDPQEGIKLLKEGFEETTAAVSDLGSAIVDTYNNAVLFANLTVEFRKLNRESELLSATLSGNAEKLEAIADDATRGFAERERAAKLARIETEKAFSEEIKIAERRAKLLSIEMDQAKIAGNINDDLLEKQKQSQIELINLRAQEQVKFLEAEKRRRELIQDRFEKDLDIEIDGFDNINTLNLKKLENEKLTAQQRQDIINETDRLGDLSFEKQLAIIQEFTTKQIDANALISESNSTLLQEKIRDLGLSEIIEGRLFEVVKERRLAEQDLLEAQKDSEKKAKEEALQALENQYVIELDQLKAQRLAELLTEEQFNEAKEELELTRLIALKAMREQIGLETVEIESQILDAELALLDKRIASEKKAASEKKKLDDAELKRRKDKIKSIAEETGAVLENARTLEGVAKGIFAIIRKEIKAALAQAVSKAIAGAFLTSPNPFIAAAAAPVAAGLVNGLFDKFVPSFNTGGKTGSGDKGLGRNAGGFIQGVVEENEFVIPAPILKSDPYVADFAGYLQNRINGNTSTHPPVFQNNISSTVDIPSSDKMEQASMNILEAVRVLTSTPLNTKLTIEDVRYIYDTGKTDLERKEQTGKRGAL